MRGMFQDGTLGRSKIDNREVYKGDEIKNNMALNKTDGQWYNNWVITPGNRGRSRGQPSFGGAIMFDPSDGKHIHSCNRYYSMISESYF